jgi:hypothetical protein
MEEKKLKSHEGKAVVMSAPAASSAAPIAMVTERNVQLHTANQKTVGTSHGGSVVSSAERSRRYEKARAAFEMAEARVAMLQAAEEMAAGSATGSVGRRLDDVRSDTGSSGPSPPIRETAVENPFAGVYSSAPYYDDSYYSDYIRYLFGKERGTYHRRIGYPEHTPSDLGVSWIPTIR